MTISNFTEKIEYSILSIKKPNSKKFKSGYIYILGFDFKQLNTYFPDLRFLKKYYKIGKTTNIINRKKNLNAGAPFPTEIIHLIKCQDIHSAEVWLHAKFNSKRSYCEWFELDENDISNLRKIKELNPQM